jgi:hypothetical protein
MDKSTKKEKMKHQGELYVDTPDGKRRGIFALPGLQILARETKMIVPRGTSALDLSYHMAGVVLRMFFGLPWLEKYITGPKATNFLVTTAPAQERWVIGITRIIHLAEMLFNLQRTAGFDEVLEKISGGAIESAFAELEAGRLLYQYGIGFRFVKRQHKEKKDYDLEFFHHNGELICGETECKIETTNLTDGTIKNTLDHARGQLPEDRPGALFVNVPQTWWSNPTFIDDFRRISKRFLNGTERIVLIEAFSFTIKLESGLLRDATAIEELLSTTHRFDRSLDWRLLTRYRNFLPEPLSWIRFTNVLGSPYNVTVSLGKTEK